VNEGKLRGSVARADYLPENMKRLIDSKSKLLVWHNYSDEKSAPFSSTRWYTRFAADFGGRAWVQRQVQLFKLHGAMHCSITSIAPNSFDAFGAIENWGECGKAPDDLPVCVADRRSPPRAQKTGLADPQLHSALRGEAYDGNDLRSSQSLKWDMTGADRITIHVDGSRPTLGNAAAELGTLKPR
jgi:Tannase and feruloyl esterase